MGIDFLDLVFRLERTFGMRISHAQVDELLWQKQPPDVTAGELFEFLRSQSELGGVLDHELDAETLWLLFQRAVSDALGVEPEDVTKDKWIVGELAAL